jgi:hypothetical protein
LVASNTKQQTLALDRILQNRTRTRKQACLHTTKTLVASNTKQQTLARTNPAKLNQNEKTTMSPRVAIIAWGANFEYWPPLHLPQWVQDNFSMGSFAAHHVDVRGRFSRDPAKGPRLQLFGVSLFVHC